MIQRRAKNRYWVSGQRWRKCWTIKTFENFDFNEYDYIIGDQIFTKDNEAARVAYDMVKMWTALNK
ncbi:MAG: hypothetical protein DRQ40_06325 [Gammaproteobacteria bacterium]|nr:MAG: hypothetical protein DRQ40_06325 [Gammaproteobacteria bacterium]